MSILKDLQEALISGDIEQTRAITTQALRSGTDPLTIVEEGLSKGLNRVGKLFEEGGVFLAELIVSAEVMKEALNIVTPELLKTGRKAKTLGRVVIGTVAGDIHSIGKNIVSAMLTANGFEVIDVGEDIPNQKFVEIVGEKKPDILGLSALLTTTHPLQREVIKDLKKAGLREKLKVIVGGRLVSEHWANEIDADAFGTNAGDAVERAKELVGA